MGAPRTNDPSAPVTHRLDQLAAWLPHIASLGTTTLLLGPVFESATHGYDTIDHLQVDRRLGDEDDLVGLVEQARGHGMRVVLDGVFNHVGRDHPRFQQVLREGPTGEAGRWFRLHPDRPGPDGFGYDDFEGHSALVALDHTEREVLDLAVDVATYWADRGVAGWRLDAAYAVPTSFWRAFADRVRAVHPGTFLLAEVIHGDYAAFAAASGVDSVTQYELWKAIWSSFNDENPHELAWALQRHAEFASSFRPLTFVGNHDVTRIASRLRDRRLVPLALAVLYTVPGLPCVYAGDELGLEGVKRDEAGGDDEVRPAFPPAPPDPEPAIAELHRSLAMARRGHPWLETGHLVVDEVDHQSLVLRVDAAPGRPGAPSCRLRLDVAGAGYDLTLG